MSKMCIERIELSTIVEIAYAKGAPGAREEALSMLVMDLKRTKLFGWSHKHGKYRYAVRSAQVERLLSATVVEEVVDAKRNV